MATSLFQIGANVVSKGLEKLGWTSKYKLLLIGETGSGKTSFLNLLCNYNLVLTLGFQVGYQHFRSFNDITLENSSKRKMVSKTSDAKAYAVELGDMHIGVIDTPGFADSRGIDQDKKNVQKIIAALKTEEYINCICLVINGRQSRMTATLRYVLSEITAILPKTVINNVIVLFTNTTGYLQLNFKPEELRQYFGQDIKHMFWVENPYCLFEKAKEKQASISTDMIAESLKDEFEKTAKQLEKMLSVVRNFEKVHTNDFLVLYQKKQEIEETIVTTLTAFNNQTRLERKISQKQQELQSAVKTKTLNEGFETTQTISRTVTVKTTRHNTLCSYPNCYSNCHMPCNLEKRFDKEEFKECWCIRGENCHVCGHNYKFHYHNEVKFEEQIEQVLKVDDVMRKKYNDAKSMEEKARLVGSQLTREKQKSEREKARLSQHLVKVINDFHGLGINRNFVMVLENQLFVVEEYLRDEQGDAAAGLRKVHIELTTKIKLVKHSLGQPCL